MVAVLAVRACDEVGAELTARATRLVSLSRGDRPGNLKLRAGGKGSLAARFCLSRPFSLSR